MQKPQPRPTAVHLDQEVFFGIQNLPNGVAEFFSAMQVIYKVTCLENEWHTLDVLSGLATLMMNIKVRMKADTTFSVTRKYSRSQVRILKKKAEAFFPPPESLFIT